MNTQPIYLALYKGRRDGSGWRVWCARATDWLTRALTRGQYSHCEIAVRLTEKKQWRTGSVSMLFRLHPGRRRARENHAAACGQVGLDPNGVNLRSTRTSAKGMGGNPRPRLRPEGRIGYCLRAAAKPPPLVLLRVVRRRIGATRRLALVAQRPCRHRARFKKAGSQTLTVSSTINRNSSYDDHLIYKF